MFELEDCLVRLARPQDRKDLIAISRGIWAGTDYLPQVVDRWLNEDWFFVCEYQGRVLACLKLTLLPDNVLWFEGLRVHRRWQGKGIARFMNTEIFRFASGLKQENPALSYEFCTYYKNYESLAITSKLGFEQQEGFYNLERRGVQHIEQPEIVQDYGLEIFAHYPKYLPINWHAVRATTAALPFIKKQATLFRTPQALYLMGTVGEPCITLLSPVPEDIQAELPYLQSCFGPRRKLSLTLPAKFAAQIPRLQQNKFYFWADEGEVALNMLVFALS
ncbi:MAG: GNAT family N-acetyltransferase [Candidatus Cloacimonetes bacterium]|jgi:GNAT superfamily N-acetyltransferase|nr:GNAT family N-acetyltransferase [Candidatus Cloacimonadota bacterium]MCB5287874.1 GNAT family N-acetyltransferase [Candidatus Cloacimonadota bacterium]MCK9185015.1 GNAT family N-acetyltransferase [Candidatus Cloacimonadota bacterium]MDY0230194.1 GNAT family N-acetyltransferase [Candidatus Cloacimonadaceae bacterium]